MECVGESVRSQARSAWAPAAPVSTAVTRTAGGARRVRRCRRARVSVGLSCVAEAAASLEVLVSSLPRRELRLVLAWAEMHAVELDENWRRAREGATLQEIEPLQ